MDDVETFEPDQQVGQELRDFFLELLKDGNLRTYRSTGRNDYIGQKRDEGIIGERAESLLRSLDGVDLTAEPPHGRATLLRLPISEIGRRFGR